MAFGALGRFPPARWALLKLARWRVAEKLAALRPCLPAGCSVVDVGTGNGVLCEGLRNAGYRVEPVDIRNDSFLPEVRPTLYDGRRLPFPDDRFDAALLVTVLHHCPDPDAVLAEARRVARRVVVIEEVFTHRWNRWATFAIDSLFNLEFFGHPHANRTDAGWRAAFAALGLRVASAAPSRSLAVLRRVVYVLEREP